MASNYLGPKWGDSSFGASGGQVTWSFAQLGGILTSYTAVIDQSAFQTAVRMAFDAWESVAVIDFVEVADNASSNIRVGWASFDGPGGVIGHAEHQYWMMANTMHYAEVSFDQAETWKANADGASSAVDFQAVAVHEIGHALGLAHSDDPTSIMYDLMSTVSGLSPEDLSGIQNLYGGKFFAAANAPQPSLVATASNDIVTGGNFLDRIFAGEGKDTVSAGSGSDEVYGNQGDDLLYGNQQSDLIYGGQGSDEIAGGQDDDQIFGNLGDDVIYGNIANDLLHGGQGVDSLHGGQGADTLNGGAGDDTLTGGLGADIFVFVPGQGNDQVADFSVEQGDKLDLSGQTYTLVEDDEGSATLTLDGGGRVVLLGVTEAEFSASFVA